MTYMAIFAALQIVLEYLTQFTPTMPQGGKRCIFTSSIDALQLFDGSLLWNRRFVSLCRITFCLRISDFLWRTISNI